MPIIEPTAYTRPDSEPLLMALHPVTLAFKGSSAVLEKPFLEKYAATSLKQVRITLGLGLFLYAAFGWLDYVVAPEQKYHFWFLRYAIVCPSVLAVTILSFSAGFKRIMQPAIAFLIIIAGGAIIYMNIIGSAAINQTYFAGLMLVLMIGCSVVRARFIWASTSGFLLVVTYLAVTVASRKLPDHVVITNNFFCLSAYALGMLASYNLEFYSRRDYFMSHMLEIERQKVESTNLRLEQTVQKRTAMLAQANEELRNEISAHSQLDQEKKQLESQLRQAQKMQAIGTLAGGIAHDFNNILSAIMGHTELAVLELEDKSKSERYLSEVLHACDRAKDLVYQILSFSRQSDSQLKPLRISTIVKEALRLIRSTLPATIDISTSIEDQESIIIANATQIHQIIMNLCTNAAHAMNGIDGDLSVSMKAIDVTLEDLQVIDADHSDSNLGPGPYVRLTVADTGHGIPRHLISRIFDPYFTTKEKDVGTGLGLAVVQGIVQTHGGAISVNSVPGHGTAFCIYLPRVESVLKDEIKTLRSLPRGNEKILFVDDDAELADLGGKLLTTLGYQVVTETDPQKALERFLQAPQTFDLVITDLIMPGLSGKALAAEILQNSSQTPVIASTGFSRRTSEAQLAEAGIRGLLKKPITIYHLAQVIRQALDEKPAGAPPNPGAGNT